VNKLTPILGIACSNQRMRELKKELVPNYPFAEVLPLGNFIESIADRFDTRCRLADELIPMIIHRIIESKNITWFSYASADSDTLKVIGDFILKCASNEVSLETFCSGEKFSALTEIRDSYEEFKIQHNLADRADREQFVRDHVKLQSDWKEKYSEIIIDQFEQNEVKFYHSKIQKDIVEMLSHLGKATTDCPQTITAKLITPLAPAFDSFDEVRQALKIARKLLLEGFQPEDILIVTSDIEEYAPVFRCMLPEYGLKGWDSKGISINQYQHTGFSLMKFNELKSQVESKVKVLEAQAIKLGISFDKDSITATLLSETRMQGDKIGIELTETNQLFGVHRIIPHLIFIGTDIEHFPPTSQGNFLYSPKQAIEYFFTNNYYSHAEAQVAHFRSHAEQLYIVTATYKGKQKLAPSLLMPKCDTPIDLSEIYALHELVKRDESPVISDEIDTYLAAAKSPEYSRFDGEEVDSVKVEHLSASQLNSYADCPLNYLYKNKIRIEPLQDDSEGFDVRQQGSLMHRCFELFGRKIKETNSIIDSDFESIMKACADTAYVEFLAEEDIKETIRHKVHFELLCGGLSDEREKGTLAKFLAYYRDLKANGHGFGNSEFEYEFRLDQNLKITDQADENYFIKGFVDRLDANPVDVSIIDYKSTKHTAKSLNKEKQAKIEEICDFQLPLYLLFAEQVWPDRNYDASLLTFNAGENDWAKSAEIMTKTPPASSRKDATLAVHFTDQYRTDLKTKIHDFHQRMNSGHFGYTNTDEKVCGYCDMRSFCHHAIFNKESAQ